MTTTPPFSRGLPGQNPHGEADFVEGLVTRWMPDPGHPLAVLDGGCGTGRVGIELARRGFAMVGVDVDPRMLESARRKAPELSWLQADLSSFEGAQPFDIAVLAGNVMIFVGRGQEARVTANIARLLRPGGLLVAGFQLQVGGLSVADYDAHARQAGFDLMERWSTWQGDPWTPASAYAVSVHQLAGA